MAKVDVILKRDTRFSEDGVASRIAREGETVSVNLTRARAWRDAGKARFADTADDPDSAVAKRQEAAKEAKEARDAARAAGEAKEARQAKAAKEASMAARAAREAAKAADLHTEPEPEPPDISTAV